MISPITGLFKEANLKLRDLLEKKSGQDQSKQNQDRPKKRTHIAPNRKENLSLTDAELKDLLKEINQSELFQKQQLSLIWEENKILLKDAHQRIIIAYTPKEFHYFLENFRHLDDDARGSIVNISC